MKNKTVTATLALFIVTALWGLTFPLIRGAVATISASSFVAWRFLFSIIVFLPFLIIKRNQISFRLLLAALIFGSLEALCYLCQTIGLQTISSAQSAFITAFSIVVAPFLAPLFAIGRPRLYDIFASAICLSGILVLTQANFSHLPVGVWWTLACALFYALSVNYLSYITNKIESSASFVGWQIVMGLPIPFLVWWGHSDSFASMFRVISGWPVAVWGALMFCALTTIITYTLQTRYQKYLSVGQFMLIYAFEPVFASVFGLLLGHEHLTWPLFVGGGLILSSFIFSHYAVARIRRLSA